MIKLISPWIQKLILSIFFFMCVIHKIGFSHLIITLFEWMKYRSDTKIIFNLISSRIASFKRRHTKKQNDKSSMILSARTTNSEHYFHLKICYVLQAFENRRKYGRTTYVKIMIAVMVGRPSGSKKKSGSWVCGFFIWKMICTIASHSGFFFWNSQSLERIPKRIFPEFK